MAGASPAIPKRPRVAVLGGGISGLTAALRLCPHAEVTLVEAGDRLGGLGTFLDGRLGGRVDGRAVERFYHCIMPTDDHLLALLEDVGLRDHVGWRSTGMGMVVGRKRYPFNTPLDLLRFHPLRLHQRVWLGAVSRALPYLPQRRDLDEVRTDEWLCGLYGKELWQRIWEPLFRSKFGPSVGAVPALYLWQRMGRERNVALRGYPRGGYKTIIDAIDSAIGERGGTVRTSTAALAVSELDGERQGVRIDLGDGDALIADWVVSTLPLPVLRRLTAADAELATQVPQLHLRYQGVVNALFVLARPLDGHYWTPILSSGTDFDGVVEMSALTGADRYGGLHLAYAMRYTERHSPLFQESDESVAERWTTQLLELYADLPLTRDDVLDVRVARAPFVEPVYPLGYRQRKPGMRVGRTRLLLATSAQVYPHVTSWNSSVELANAVVEELVRLVHLQDVEPKLQLGTSSGHR